MKTSIRNKKGFTIVELVIVIAVIAILAAVLIPTFANLVEKANLSADEQAVKQMNTALKIYEAENGKPDSSGGVKTALYTNGINTDTMTPVTQGYAFYWDREENLIVLVGADKEEPKDGWVLMTTNGYGKQTEVHTLDALTAAINASTTTNPALIKLTEDITFTSNVDVGEGKSVVIDLNKKTLTSGDYMFKVAGGGSLSVKNGNISANKRVFENSNSSLVLEGIEITNENAGAGSICHLQGISDTSIVDCEITTSYGFVIGTNSSPDENDGARLSIIDSKLTSTRNTACAINITIGSTVLIDSCTISGGQQGAFLRGCNATIKNSTFLQNGKSAKGNKWSQGNNGPVAAIVFASGGTKEFIGYFATATYKCTNVTASTVIVHEPEGGKVTVSGIDKYHKCTLGNGKSCTGSDETCGKETN